MVIHSYAHHASCINLDAELLLAMLYFNYVEVFVIWLICTTYIKCYKLCLVKLQEMSFKNYSTVKWYKYEVISVLIAGTLLASKEDGISTYQYIYGMSHLPKLTYKCLFLKLCS